MCAVRAAHSLYSRATGLADAAPQRGAHAPSFKLDFDQVRAPERVCAHQCVRVRQCVCARAGVRVRTCLSARLRGACGAVLAMGYSEYSRWGYSEYSRWGYSEHSV
jgi:hypothetical protein